MFARPSNRPAFNLCIDCESVFESLFHQIVKNYYKLIVCHSYHVFSMLVMNILESEDCVVRKRTPLDQYIIEN